MVSGSPIVTPATYTLKNLIDDSSFEGTTNYWTQYNSSYPATFTTSYKYKGSYGIQANVNGIYERCVKNKTAVSIVSGHKYYMSLWAYIISYTSGDTTSFYVPILGHLDLYESRVGQWQYRSKIITAGSSISTTDIRVGHVYSNTANNNIAIDCVMLVDLTEAFGAGNEPTEQWCDANIAWFDGTTTLEVKDSPVARNVLQPYIGVDNVARSVKRGWIGVDNVARQFFGEAYDEWTITMTTDNTSSMAVSYTCNDSTLTMSAKNNTGYVDSGTASVSYVITGLSAGDVVVVNYNRTIDMSNSYQTCRESFGSKGNTVLYSSEFFTSTSGTVSLTKTFTLESTTFRHWIGVTRQIAQGITVDVKSITVNGEQIFPKV